MSRGVRLTLGIALGAAAIALLAIFGFASSSHTKTAPELPSEHLAGAPITLQGLLGGADGRASLVVFWAGWCEPCQREAPEIEHFAQSADGKGRVVGVNWGDARSDAVAFVHRYDWTFPNVRDGKGTIGNEYELENLPTTFVLDSSGRIRRALRGPQTEASLRQALRAVESA